MDVELVDITDSDNDNNNIGQSSSSLDEDLMKCQVCGMSATTRHFGGIACRACGAFFRRSVVLNKEFNCRCALKKFATGIGEKQFCCRIFCRACRLKRCLEIGMRPEAVRAAHFRRFHEERRATTNLAISVVREASNSKGDGRQQGKLPKMEPSDSSISSVPIFSDLDSFYLNLLLPLLPLESRMHRIFSSTTLLPNEYFDKFKNLGDLIDYKENMLDQYNKFSDKRPDPWPRMVAIKFLEETGFWKDPHYLGRFFQNMMLSVDMVKTIPVFSKLEIEDRKKLLKDTVQKVSQFSMAYFSLDVCNEAIVWADGANIFELFSSIARHYKSDLMVNAAYKLFVNPMTEMNRVRPSKEEFVLLLAMLVSNPASPGLSEKAKLLLNAEAEKYGKILMQYEQKRLGQSAGVTRYMELQSLLWNAITSTYKVREMYAYFDTVLDQGCFNKAFTPVFRQLTIEASEENN